ncbi:hypothetical protein NQT62_13505 [Limnobacter humi]|uniref:Type II/III secretion system secretin-like domain-containing protein n=1 Tax=Limnobacter humi TaxID=1778671 RepID=A0ABT1WIU9_9BURK|nr:hypothetical protein [Limnobacter humi]MCQ8897452.1 hypothetical protein [Limnobacter humi]
MNCCPPRNLGVVLLLTALAACTSTTPAPHLADAAMPHGGKTPTQALWITESAHQPVEQSPALAHPLNLRIENLPASHVLELVAQDMRLGYSFDACGVQPVSLVGRDLPLRELMALLGEQTDAVVSLEKGQLKLRCDKDELRLYKLDYLSIARQMSDSSRLSSAVANQAVQPGERRESGNRSDLTLLNEQDHNVWEKLTAEIEQLIQAQLRPQEFSTQERTREEDKDRAFESNRDSNRSRFLNPRRTASSTNSNQREVTTTRREVRSGRVIVNPESGTVAVLAKPSQHARVAQWLKLLQQRLDRQVILEAVITEVTLNDRFERGIDWNLLRDSGTRAGLLVQGLNTVNPVLTVTASRTGSSGESSVVLRLLEEFGKASVLSSPRIVAMNQQPSVLKVIDNRVYFTTDVQTSAPTQNSPAFSTYNTQVQTVPVGFLMTVTPQIADNNAVQLRVRPTLSRIVGFVQDPNPALRQLNIVSQVPEIQTRELESVLKLRDGEMALLGGLRQQELNTLDRGIPGSPDALDPITQSQRRSNNQIELVVLLKATVLDSPSISASPQGANNDPAFAQNLRYGLFLSQHGDTAQATRLMHLMTTQYPDAPEPWFNLALLAHEQGLSTEVDNAIEQSRARCAQQTCQLPFLALLSLNPASTARAQPLP